MMYDVLTRGQPFYWQAKGVQLRRIHNAEMMLTASLPGYGADRQRTARLIPAIY
jgi:hypothetical protein